MSLFPLFPAHFPSFTANIISSPLPPPPTGLPPFFDPPPSFPPALYDRKASLSSSTIPCHDVSPFLVCPLSPPVGGFFLMLAQRLFIYPSFPVCSAAQGSVALCVWNVGVSPSSGSFFSLKGNLQAGSSPILLTSGSLLKNVFVQLLIPFSLLFSFFL